MFSLFKVVFLLLPYAIYCYFVWLIRYSRHPEKYPIEMRYYALRKVIKKVNKYANCEFKVVNQDKLPNTTCCIMSNHVGTIDPICYIDVNDKPISFVAKKEISKYPLAGRGVKALGGKFLDRQDLKQSLRVMMEVQADLEKGEKNWLIFPEGTRNKDIYANLNEFHHGTFRAPMKAKVPIVPACTFGSFKVFKKPHLKRSPIYIEYGDPLYYEDYKDMSTNEVASIIQARVQAMVNFHARKYYQERMASINKKACIK